MKKILEEDYAKFIVMKTVRYKIKELLSDAKKKEIYHIISIILFYKDDEIFFPVTKDWYEAVRKKFIYMEIKDPEDKLDKLYKIFQEGKEYYNKIKNRHKIEVIGKKKKEHYLINNKLRIPIYENVYKKLKKWAISTKQFDLLYCITLLRYEILLSSGNHQLGIDYSAVKLDQYDIELFASPINRTLPNFCGLYQDIDKFYKGSLGSIWNFKLLSNKRYTMNPPYVEELMTRAVKKVLAEIENLNNVHIFITIPIWDVEQLKEYGYKPIKDAKYEPYELLKESKYLTSIEAFNLESYQYINHISGKLVNAAHTYHIVLDKK